MTKCPFFIYKILLLLWEMACLLLDFLPGAGALLSRRGWDVRKTQKIQSCPTARTIMKLIKMEVQKWSARKLTNRGKGNLTMQH